MDFELDDPMLLWREDVQADPRPLYDRLRRDAPVWRLPGQRTYLVSDPELIREAVARPNELSSNLVSVLHLGDDGRPATFESGSVGGARCHPRSRARCGLRLLRTDQLFGGGCVDDLNPNGSAVSIRAATPRSTLQAVRIPGCRR
jgi:hypothetical protein